MPHAAIRPTNEVSAPALNDPRDKSWDEALANDLAILGPVADAFGWLCRWSMPGSYQVGRYDVSWREETPNPVWDLGYMVSEGDSAEPVYLATTPNLPAVAATIVKHAVDWLAARGKLP